MLADEIIALAGTEYDNKGVFGAYSIIAASIARAQRFNISSEVHDAADHLAHSKPSSLLHAVPRCRLPFKSVWLEWVPPMTARNDSDINNQLLGITAVPRRFGILCESFDDTLARFGATFCWVQRGQPNTKEAMAAQLTKSLGVPHLPKDIPQFILDNDRVDVCAYGYVINWFADWPIMSREEIVTGLNNHASRLRRTGVVNVNRAAWLSNKDEFDAMVELNSMATLTAVPSMLKFINVIHEKASFSLRERFMEAAKADIEGELPKLMSVLCLLNSKNCISSELVKFDKLNVKRQRNNKKPLLSYSEVKINLSRRDAMAASGSGMTKEEIRRHIVRGHFKIRKSGVYFWRPFIRGTAKVGEVRRSGYSVVDRQPITTAN